MVVQGRAQGTCRERVKSGAAPAQAGGSATKEYSNALLDVARMNVHYPMTILFLTCEDNGSSGRFLIFCRFLISDPLYCPQRFRVFVQPVYFVIREKV